MDVFEKKLASHLAQKNGAESAAAPTFVVPVVVHIVHGGGAENISDAQVFTAIEHLNEAFAAGGYFAQKDATVDSKIQFCLALRDPDGNATTGITRDQSPLTEMVMETQDIPLKNINRWKPTDYVNIWVVKEISSQSIGSGVAGYAFFPSSHGGANDGMVCEAQFFGKSPAEDGVLIHEMGHYFGLYHTFEGGCKNDDCATDGDRICDTPPDQAKHTTCPYNSCSTDVAPGSPFTVDVEDLTGDFMDYSPFSCYFMFTAGQAARMQAVVEAARKSLLGSQGCLDPCTVPVTASFSAAPNPVFAGQAVVFTNTSTGAAGFEWSENGTVFSQNINETRVFTAPGSYLIQLSAIGSEPNCSDKKFATIEVTCPVLPGFSFSPANPKEGETVTFTNGTTGGATAFEWRINGQTVSSAAGFSYTFNSFGGFSVVLQAVGPFCSAEKQVWLNVAPKCGGTDTTVVFTDGNTTPRMWKVVPLPDGSSIFAGAAPYGAIARVDAQKKPVWIKKMNSIQGFWELVQLADGNFLAANQQVELVKFDQNGNILWAKRSLDILLSGWIQPQWLLANPDSTFCLLSATTPGQPDCLSKFDLNGNLLWSTRFKLPLQLSGIVRLSDGTGDFVAMGCRTPNFFILRFSPGGVLLKTKRYQLQGAGLAQSMGQLFAHPDGGFSAFHQLANYATDPVEVFGKKIIRFGGDGKLVWAKKYQTAGTTGIAAGIAYLPGEGWFGLENRTKTLAPGGCAFRISENGEPLWTRDFDKKHLDIGYFSGYKRSGALRFISQSSPVGLLWASVLDDPAGQHCLLGQPFVENVADQAILEFDTTLVSQPFFPKTTAITPAVTNGNWTRADLCQLPLPCLEVCDNQLDDDGDGFVDCFDTDCACSSVDTACTVSFQKMPISGKIDWESSESLAHEMGTPIVADLDPGAGGIPEIIVPSGMFDTVFIYRGDGSNLANPDRLQVATPATAIEAVPLVADIDRDGSPELLLGTATGKIKVFKNYQPGAVPPMQLWLESAPAVGDWANRLAAADFDGDGVPEVFMGNQIFAFDLSNPAAPVLAPKLKGQGHAGKVPTFNAGLYDVSQAADLLSVTDCNGDPDCNGLELAAGAHIYSIDLDPNDGDGLQIKIQRNLNPIGTGQTFDDGPTQVADINLDGLPDILVNASRTTGNTTTDGFYAYDKNGPITFVLGPAFGPMPHGQLTIANLFDDRKMGFPTDLPEVVQQWYGLDAKLVAFNLNAAAANPADPYWWKAPSSDISALSFAPAFDFDRDGFDEIVLKGETNLRVYYGGPAPFPVGVDPVNRTWFEMPSVNSTGFDGPVVADVDGDAAAEIVYIWRENYLSQQRGKLRVVGSANLPWPAAHPIWNQYNYFGLNINDDLTVPKTQQKHWLEMGGIGSGKRPFNAHLAQVTGLNPLVSNKLKVPDATIAVDSVRCNLDSIDLFLKIENLGSADFLPKIAVSFYKTDPTTTAAPLLFPPVFLDKKIKKDSSLFVKMTIPATYNQPVFVAINDDGSTARPFVLTNDTISTGQPECHLENNLAQFTFPHATPPLDLGPDLLLCESSVAVLSAPPGFQKYRWQDGSDGQTFTAFGPGKYWVDAFDACGFKKTDTLGIKLNTLTALGLPADLTICAGDTLAIAATGFFDEFAWSPADSVSCAGCPNPFLIPKKSITLTLTARSGNCFVTDSVHVKVLPAPTVEIAATDGDCGNPASLVATAAGNGPFLFNWSNNQPGTSITTTQSGTYTVNTTDANGCAAQNSASVFVTNSLSISAIPQNPVCHGSTNGFIQLTATGNNGNVQFSWSNGATAANLTGLAAGSFAVTATSASGCTFSQNFTLTEPPLLIFTENHMDATCPTATDGSASLSISGGTPGFSIKWANGATAPAINGLSAGNYPFTVTDAAGCTATGFVEIKATDVQSPVVKLKPATVPIDVNGKASMTLALFDDGSTDNCGITGWTIEPPFFECTQLGTQAVTLTATDASGNIASQTVLVQITDNKPPVLTCPADKTAWWCSPIVAYAAPVAFDNCLGAGGQYALDSGLPSGSTFPVGVTFNQWTFTDGSGNVGACAFTVTVFEKPLIDFGAQPPLCHGDCTGTAIATVSGSAGPFHFLWENGQATASANMLCAGPHTVTVTDGGGCQTVESFPLTEPNPLTINLLSKTDDLGGAGLGAISVAVGGGVTGLVFTWEKDGLFFSNSQNLTGLTTGSYVLKVVDANGCTLISQPILIDNLVAATEPDWTNGMLLRPNPTDDKAELFFQKRIEGELTIEVFDEAGRRIEVMRFADGGQGFAIDLRERAAGFYQLKITTGGCAVSRKLVRI